MISVRSQIYMIKLTLEAQSAHAIHTGFGDTTHDSLVVRDANGLPALPASSIAGVLRSAYQKQFGKDETEKLFGFAKGEQGQSSWLNIGWGLVHNSQNIAQEGLLDDTDLQDKLLQHLLNVKPIVRQRVKLNDKGTTANTGKFDITLIPAGTRYSTQLHYWCDGSDHSRTLWQNLLALLQMPLRLGQGTRNGYGLFKVQSLTQVHWDLKNPVDAQKYRNRSRGRANQTGFEIVKNDTVLNTTQAKLSLQAESFWRIGGGELYLKQLKDNDRAPDLLPMHESKINWNNGEATLSEQFYLLPASAIKGALRHRVAYHYNCLTGAFIEDGNCVETDENEAVKALFGYAKDEKDEGQAGIIAIKDIFLVPNKEKLQTVMHNKIDRFTSGVIHGALFSEANLYQSNIDVLIEVVDNQRSLDSNIKKALELTLDDLAQGWLPLGAFGSRGLGVFLDTQEQGVVWSDDKKWIQGEA